MHHMNTCIVPAGKNFEVWSMKANGSPGHLIQSFPSERQAKSFAANQQEIADSLESMPAKDRPF